MSQKKIKKSRNSFICRKNGSDELSNNLKMKDEGENKQKY